MPDPAVAALRAACKGLLYPSEADAPFRAFRWKSPGGEISGERVAALAGKGQAGPVEAVGVDDFFAELADSDDTARFQVLRRALEQHLDGLRVYRLGKVRVAIYLVGKIRDGDWAGVRTVSVET